MLDLHRLTILREVKLRGGVSAAARSLSYSHSAVSQQLSQLERDVGVELLERVGRGVRLTPAAEQLVVHTDRILEEVERATSSIAKDRGEPQGTVRIAAFSTISRVVLPAALDALARDYPQLQVVFGMDDPAEAVVQLATKQVDLVVADSYPGSPEPTSGDIISTTIGEDPIRVYLPEHVPADVESLARVPWAMEPATDSSAEWALRVCRDMGFEPRVRYIAPDLLFQLRLVERGLAAAMLPDLVVGEAGTLAIAYETVQDHTGLPLLTPMSEVAGRLAAHAAAAQLTVHEGGPGLLLGGVPGVAPCRVLVIGGGVVGTQAAKIALGMQAEVTVLDTSPRRIRELDELFGGSVRVLMSDTATVGTELSSADVVVGAVLVPGRAAPKVVTRDQLSLLKPTTLLIDEAIDQGGAFETSRPTTYAEPTFEVDGIRHYCVANMPDGVPRTSTRALTNATLPYVLRLADGVEDALGGDQALGRGVNTRGGRILVDGVAAAFPDLPAEVSVPVI